MASPGLTLTQLGEYNSTKTPAPHSSSPVRCSNRAGVVEFVEAGRLVPGQAQKYYHATPRAPCSSTRQSLQKFHKIGSASPSARWIRVSNTWLTTFNLICTAPISLLPIPVSSLDGLIALRQGLCQMSTCHLIDP